MQAFAFMSQVLALIFGAVATIIAMTGATSSEGKSAIYLNRRGITSAIFLGCSIMFTLIYGYIDRKLDADTSDNIFEMRAENSSLRTEIIDKSNEIILLNKSNNQKAETIQNQNVAIDNSIKQIRLLSEQVFYLSSNPPVRLDLDQIFSPQTDRIFVVKNSGRDYIRDISYDQRSFISVEIGRENASTITIDFRMKDGYITVLGGPEDDKNRTAPRSYIFGFRPNIYQDDIDSISAILSRRLSKSDITKVSVDLNICTQLRGNGGGAEHIIQFNTKLFSGENVSFGNVHRRSDYYRECMENWEKARDINRELISHDLNTVMTVANIVTDEVYSSIRAENANGR